MDFEHEGWRYNIVHINGSPRISEGSLLLPDRAREGLDLRARQRHSRRHDRRRRCTDHAPVHRGRDPVGRIQRASTGEVGVTRISLAGLAAAILWALVTGTPVAQASPACEHRSAAHVAEHGGLTADSAWHIAHGDLPTCDRAETEPSDQEDDQDDKPWRRDSPGFHCTWRGCG